MNNDIKKLYILFSRQKQGPGLKFSKYIGIMYYNYEIKKISINNKHIVTNYNGICIDILLNNHKHEIITLPSVNN